MYLCIIICMAVAKCVHNAGIYIGIGVCVQDDNSFGTDSLNALLQLQCNVQDTCYTFTPTPAEMQSLHLITVATKIFLI